MCRVQAVAAELSNSLMVDQVIEIFIIPDLDLLDFVRCTETIEEVDEGKFALDCCAVRNGSQIHDFLYAGFAEHCTSGLTGSIDVGVITEDVQRVRTDSTCCNVADSRKTFAGDLVEVRDHQKKTLGSGECRGHSTGCDGAVDGASRTCFGLHFRNLYFLTEDVLSSGSCPLIDMLGHDG